MYSKHVNPLHTPATSPLLGQVPNSAGGFTFAVGKFERLERFLILGCEGGTYYATERKLTLENAKCVIECIAEDLGKTVNTIVAISEAGRAPKNDAAIFALALCLTHAPDKRLAYAVIPRVCRTGTHLFTLVQCIKDMRKWSRGLRTGVANWYTSKSWEDLEYQLLKYKQRGGWTHCDVLRLCHAKPKSAEVAFLLRHAVGKDPEVVPPRTEAVRSLTAKTPIKDVIRAVETHNLSWEMLPTEALANPDVWAALLPRMPLTALIRNLGRMSANGLISSNLTNAARIVEEKLSDAAYIQKSRLHPMSILTALRTYQQGRGDKGKLTWSPASRVVNALDSAFYLAFKNVVPTNKNFLLALDVSGSMGMYKPQGMPITAREASAVMALVTMATEPNCEIVGFSHNLVRLNITPKMSLGSVVAAISNIPFGATDPALPMQYATAAKLPVDLFACYTDNEVNCGTQHASQALRHYRAVSGRAAKSVVVGMTATNFTIADPNDRGTLDIVGLDTNCPAIISDFAAS